MNKNRFFLLVLLLLAIPTLFSQEFYRRNVIYMDTTTFMIWATPNFAVHFPFGNNGYLDGTFKHNYKIGLDLTFKTKSNLTFDFSFNYMFGSKIRLNPKELFGDMVIYLNDTTVAFFNGEGNHSVELSQEGRYWNLNVSVGKIVPLDRWKNSGLWFKAGIGFFSHKIYFADSYKFFPQIDQKTYRLGYDRRSSGVALNQFFGYLFLRQKRVLSFYVGIEIWEVFTKPNRGYIFVGEYAGPTDKLLYKFSGLIGVKAGWNLPFYEKKRVVTLYTY
ncbi:MAG: hypothetical protein LBI45_04710 [Bacteroidales bacterium]|jgi:hypothetical protein|nr:hypothetical protein [Bacteroidales bacterium]